MSTTTSKHDTSRLSERNNEQRRSENRRVENVNTRKDMRDAKEMGYVIVNKPTKIDFLFDDLDSFMQKSTSLDILEQAQSRPQEYWGIS